MYILILHIFGWLRLAADKAACDTRNFNVDNGDMTTHCMGWICVRLGSRDPGGSEHILRWHSATQLLYKLHVGTV